MRKVTGDGRRAALDLRLVGEPSPAEGGKLTVAAQRIAAIHHATREHRYTDEHGQLTIRPGALQLVRSEEHTSELQSLMRISYAVFCLKKKNKMRTTMTIHQYKP